MQRRERDPEWKAGYAEKEGFCKKETANPGPVGTRLRRVFVPVQQRGSTEKKT